jgi:hypothetical protein
MRPTEIMARYTSVSWPLSVWWWLVASSPLPSGPAPRMIKRTKETTKGKTQQKRTKVSGLQVLLLFYDQQLFLAPGTQLLRLHPLLLFYFSQLRESHSDTSLRASSSAATGISLRTSVVERKSMTGWLHLASVRVSDFVPPQPVSFCTSTDRIFCWAFKWRQFLTTCSCVCVLYGHHQHLALGWFLVHSRYCLQLVEPRGEPLGTPSHCFVRLLLTPHLVFLD